VLAEAERLLQAGVKELLVISQDTSAYGVDVKYRTGFWQGRPLKTRMTELATALDAMARARGAWARLHYVYPYPHVDEVIERMTPDPARGGLLPYLDVPFQHASARILKLMKRPANAEGTLRRIEAWRAARPDLVLRSTFIVGFPGETEREFDELLAFVDAAQLDRVGCFAYSPVEGAAANALPDPVPEDVKAQRARFMAVQARVAPRASRAARDDHRAGGAHEGKSAIARSAAIRRIDGIVRVIGARLAAGEFARVAITGTTEHDLEARIAR
jgi:ribosomal protein S12 methylthiotransferase